MHKRLLSDKRNNVKINSPSEEIITNKIISSNNELTNLPKKTSISNMYSLNT